MNDWQFDDPPNVAVITTRQVIEEDYPILYVSHDEDDGGWQVLCGTTNETSDGRVISLRSAVEKEPKLVELADLPLGWCAYRESKDQSWQRAPKKA